MAGKCDGQCLADPIIPQEPVSDNFVPLPVDANIWCFREFNERLRFENAWGKFSIEAKETTDSTCGPGANSFSRDFVSFDSTTNELTLEFAFLNGQWFASEVRINMEEPFPYGKFSVRVKSIAVFENGIEVSNRLPADTVLGIFTFDVTEPGKVAPFHREVDFEVSRWGRPTGPDVQFLIQPMSTPGPHFPLDRRFYSGGEPGSYDQSGHFFNITWNPTSVHWSTDAGNGQQYTYSTSLARISCTEDFIQCLPHNVDLRLNLWGINGTNQAPAFEGVENVEAARVVVVIDHVDFMSSGIRHAADGEECSKDCQCSDSSTCFEGICSNRP